MSLAPLKLLKVGESIQVESDSSSSKYTIKRVDDGYTCTCFAWKMQKGVTPDARTCKHLRTTLGDAYETARLAAKGITLATTDTNTKKRKKKDQDKDDDDVDSGKKTKRAKSQPLAQAEKIRVDVLLANKFELGGKKDPTGWLMSEKLDGIRAYWDGKGGLWSRLGNKFYAPNWFIRLLPKGHILDGEIFHSRNNFSVTSSIVRSQSSPRWNELRYKVFDIPSESTLTFEDRLKKLQKMFPENDDPAPADPNKYQFLKSVIRVVEHTKCTSLDHLMDTLKDVEALGGEGLMLREPGSIYVGKRSNTLLKVKTFFDAEAKIIGYEKGKGKYKGMTGSLLCEMESGKTFSVGSGLNDDQRQKPPKIGAIVSYRFQEVTKDGVPRFPTFVGERIDMNAPKDADVSRKGTGSKVDDEDED